MPDISLCQGFNCPSKDTCYRYTAETSKFQTYKDFHQQRISNHDKCEWYWKDDAATQDKQRGYKKRKSKYWNE